MDIWVSSRTKTEDYVWRNCSGMIGNEPPSSVTNGYDQWKFEDCIPWYGLVSQADNSILYFGNIPKYRFDSRGRPIFVHAALRTNDAKERWELVQIVSSLLVREDDELARWTKFLIGLFDGKDGLIRPSIEHLPDAMQATEPIGHFAYPRKDVAARKLVASKLLACDISRPMAVGSSGRDGKGLYERICNSEPDWQVAFFSDLCTSEEILKPKEVRSDFTLTPSAVIEWSGKNRKLVAGIVAVIVLVSLVKSCLGPSPELEKESLPLKSPASIH